MVDKKISKQEEIHKTSSREEDRFSQQEDEEKTKTSTKVAWTKTNSVEQDRVSQHLDRLNQQGTRVKTTSRKEDDKTYK